MLPSALTPAELEAFDQGKTERLSIETNFKPMAEENSGFASRLAEALSELADDSEATSSATTINSSASYPSSCANSPGKLQTSAGAGPINLLGRQVHQKKLSAAGFKDRHRGISLLRTSSNSGYSSPRVLLAPHPSPATSYPTGENVLSPTLPNSQESFRSPDVHDTCQAPPPTPISASGSSRAPFGDHALPLVPSSIAAKLVELEKESNDGCRRKASTLDDFLAPSYALYEATIKNEQILETVRQLSQRVEALERQLADKR